MVRYDRGVDHLYVVEPREGHGPHLLVAHGEPLGLDDRVVAVVLREYLPSCVPDT